MNTHKIRTVVVDDEQEGRDVLQSLLEGFKEIELIGMADGAETGLDLILRTRPDLVFLDIRMPRKTGIEVAAELSGNRVRPSVVFVTAFDEYAILAIRVAAFDFLLKPVDPDELRQVISRYQKEMGQDEFDRKIKSLIDHLTYPDRIKVNTGRGFLMIDPDEILYIQADGRYTYLFMTGHRKECLTINIGEFEKQLTGGRFFKGSRSVIINLKYFVSFHRMSRECRMDHNGEIHKIKIAKNAVADLERSI